MSSDKEGESSDESGQFIVEAILAKRVNKGKTEYLIKWQGYDDPEDNTWEPTDNCDCAELIENFEKTYVPPEPKKKPQPKEKEKKPKESKPSKSHKEARSSRTRSPSDERIISSSAKKKSREFIVESDDSDSDESDKPATSRKSASKPVPAPVRKLSPPKPSKEEKLRKEEERKKQEKHERREKGKARKGGESSVVCSSRSSKA
ncbi:Chromo domain-containing protein [Aphelenchoides bicaudatus]|nr:Chromo domain-containing protein [Aphelenchoides bicaudatus]